MQKPDHTPFPPPPYEKPIMIRRLWSRGSAVILALLFTFIAPADATAQEAPGPTDVGIAVHGAWTVTVVREGDVVERREFRNALTNSGEIHLAQLLSGDRFGGPWIIVVEADGAGTLCADNEYVAGEDTDCAISESGGEATASAVDPVTSLTLEGSETVVRDASITAVGTHQWVCGAGPCQATGGEIVQSFTSRVLDTPIAVLAGDRIEVTVEISFN